MHTIPSCRSANSVFPTDKFKSSEVQDIVKQYKRICRVSGNPTFINSLLKSFENSQVNIAQIGEYSSKIFSTDESSQALSYKKVTIIKYINACNFANMYFKELLNYIYFLETKELDNTISSDITKAEIKEIKDGFLDFCLAINILNIDYKRIIDSLEELPDANVTELTESTFASTLGQAKMDPLGMNNFTNAISVKWNIFYWYATNRAEYTVNQYKLSKQKLELLQLRKYNLEKLQAKEPDAKLEKEIEYLQDRISSLAYKLKEQEESYGI